MSSPSSVEPFLRSCAAQIEAHFERCVPDDWQVEPTLLDSIRYSLFAGGKRIRPALLIATLEANDVPLQFGLDAACAIEMVHTYSLIHDDLPAMDDDDMRRGKPTNHVVYGEAVAILAGDGLLTHAFYLMTRIAAQPEVGAERALRAISELAKSAGLGGMVSGQAADMKGEQGLTSLDQLQAIHRDKTGALIAASLKIGGILSGVNETQLHALERFGYCIGLAFQIQDDVLDLIGDVDKLGKPLQSDTKSEKVTYPYFLGIEQSKAEVARLTDEAKQCIQSCQFQKPEILLQIADYLLKRDF